MTRNDFTLKVLERTYSRPTILGLSLLEPIVAVTYIYLASSIVQRLVLSKLQPANNVSSLGYTVTARLQNSFKLQPLSSRSQNAGFTIIEVLIVLAIAGLILLIVFLAVPALQRNSRNATKRSDASKAFAAVGEFMASNGSVPPATADLGTLQASANLSNGTTLTSTIPTTVAAVTTLTINQIEIGTGMACVSGGGAGTTSPAPTAAQWQAEVQTASSRSVVALYATEAAGGNITTQCLAT